MVYIGIDLGGTGIKIGVVDESGTILSQGETPTLAGRPTRTSSRTWAAACWM